MERLDSYGILRQAIAKATTATVGFYRHPAIFIVEGSGGVMFPKVETTSTGPNFASKARG